MELNLKNPVKFTPQNEADSSDVCVGGIINEGKLEWIAKGSLFEIYCTQTGTLQYQHIFDKCNFGPRKCSIACVEELSGADVDGHLLAIGIEYDTPPLGMIALFSINKWILVRTINLSFPVSCCKQFSRDMVGESPLHVFQYVLGVGSRSGDIILLDIRAKDWEENVYEIGNSLKDRSCNLVQPSANVTKYFEESLQKKEDFGVVLPELDQPSGILCLLPVKQLKAFLVGCEDGRLIFYSSKNFRIFNVIRPKEYNAPLHHLAMVEPIDDPRAYAYVWALHSSCQKPLAIMYSLLYLKKRVDDNGQMIYENFQSSNRVLEITSLTVEAHSQPIGCQSIVDCSKLLSLCFLAWRVKDGIELLLFDVNQWYKENMPRYVDAEKDPNFLVPYYARNCNFVLDFWINDESVREFRWTQRPEEYCFPISLSFDCLLLQKRGNTTVSWPGLQRCALNMLENGGALAFLDPDPFYSEMVKACLIPQNSERNLDSITTLETRRELLLSVALEYECIALLRECATAWSDGSHFGEVPYKGLSISTLTEWIWHRAKALSDRCCSIVAPLFDNSGMTIGEVFKKNLLQCIWQLKFLSTLLNDVLCKCKVNLPSEVFTTLSSQKESINMAVKYYEVVQWFEKLRLLPEQQDTNSRCDEDKYFSCAYPYKKMKSFYDKRREEFRKLNHVNLSSGNESCRFLYIDKFIEEECTNQSELKEDWIECGGDSLYPPPSFQAMLRMLLVPRMPIAKKYELLSYFFLDLSFYLGDKYEKNVFNIGLSSIFGQNPFVRETVKAFWDLDHGNFKDIWYALPSPPQYRRLCTWELELLLEALLIQNQTKHACHILHFVRTPIEPLLELKIYLTNRSLSEAFSFVRSKADTMLLREFFKHCLNIGKYEILCDLFLTDEEETILDKVIDTLKSPRACNAYLAYLLRQNEFFKASLCYKKLSIFSMHRGNLGGGDLEVANDMLNLYKKTMNPHTRKLFENYLRNCGVEEFGKQTTLYPKARKLIRDVKQGQFYSENILKNINKKDHSQNSNSLKQRNALLIPIIGCIYKNGHRPLRDSIKSNSVSSILKRKNIEIFKSPKKLTSAEEMEHQKSTRFYLSRSFESVYTEIDQQSELLPQEGESPQNESSFESKFEAMPSVSMSNVAYSESPETVKHNLNDSYLLPKASPRRTLQTCESNMKQENTQLRVVGQNSTSEKHKPFGATDQIINNSKNLTTTGRKPFHTSEPLLPSLKYEFQSSDETTEKKGKRSTRSSAELNSTVIEETESEVGIFSTSHTENIRSTRRTRTLLSYSQSQGIEKNIHETLPVKSLRNLKKRDDSHLLSDNDDEKRSTKSAKTNKHEGLLSGDLDDQRSIKSRQSYRRSRVDKLNSIQSDHKQSTIYLRNDSKINDTVLNVEEDDRQSKRSRTSIGRFVGNEELSTRSPRKLRKIIETNNDARLTLRKLETLNESTFVEEDHDEDNKRSTRSTRKTRRLRESLLVDNDNDGDKCSSRSASRLSRRLESQFTDEDDEGDRRSTRSARKGGTRRESQLIDDNEDDDKRSTRSAANIRKRRESHLVDDDGDENKRSTRSQTKTGIHRELKAIADEDDRNRSKRSQTKLEDCFEENENDDKMSTHSQSIFGRKVLETLATPRRSLRARRTSVDSTNSVSIVTPLKRSKRKASTNAED